MEFGRPSPFGARDMKRAGRLLFIFTTFDGNKDFVGRLSCSERLVPRVCELTMHHLGGNVVRHVLHKMRLNCLIGHRC